MNSLFTHKDEKEGNIGIGKILIHLHNTLNEIAKEYKIMIPDKNMTTYHSWYEYMPPSIKQNIDKIQYNKFWNKLCDGNKNYRIMHVNEMNELYYSNPKNS